MFRYVILIGLLSVSSFSHAEIDIIFYDSAACDFHNRVCGNFRITHSRNDNIIEIRGRTSKPAGAGDLVFHFQGITPLNETIEHQIMINLKGRYNEIVSAKFKPPLSNETEWSLKTFVFEPEAKTQ